MNDYIKNCLHAQSTEDKEIPLEWLKQWLNNAPLLVIYGHPLYTRSNWWSEVRNGNTSLGYVEALKSVLEAVEGIFDDEYFWNFDYRFEMRPLHPVIRNTIKIALQSASMELDGPESQKYSNIINYYTHDAYTPVLTNITTVSQSILGAINSLYKGGLFEILTRSDNGGPFDGACLVCAKGIQQAYGGDLVRIISTNLNHQTEHYGVLIDGTIYDFSGAFQSSDEWIKWFAKEQFCEDRELAFATGLDERCDHIIDDASSSKEIAKLLRIKDSRLSFLAWADDIAAV